MIVLKCCRIIVVLLIRELFNAFISGLYFFIRASVDIFLTFELKKLLTKNNGET